MSKNLPVFSEVECSCDKCKNMCHNRPCWGYVDEFERILNEHPELAKSLMLDYWVGKDGEPDTLVLCGSNTKGSLMAAFFPYGKCNLLDKDNLCKLHKIDFSLKPFEGRISSCKTRQSDEAFVKHYKLREDIVQDWKSDKALILINRWKKMVNYYG